MLLFELWVDLVRPDPNLATLHKLHVGVESIKIRLDRRVNAVLGVSMEPKSADLVRDASGTVLN